MKIPSVQESASRNNAVCWGVLPPCMVAAGSIGIAHGFLLGLTAKNELTLAGLLLGAALLAMYGALVGAVAGGLWGFLMYVLFFRKTLNRTIFYSAAAISLATGVASLLYLHFIQKDAEPVSIFFIPLGTLFAAVAMRIRLATKR